MRISAVLFLLVVAYTNGELHFFDNLWNINSPKCEGKTYTLGLLPNTEQEKAILLDPLKDPGFGTSVNSQVNVTAKIINATANVVPPDSFNWRNVNSPNPFLVTRVRDQGSCSSSYAFAFVAAVESMVRIWESKTRLDLSEQQVIDCSGEYGSNGCNGGTLQSGFKYVSRNKLKLEKVYPYNATKGACRIIGDDKKGFVPSLRYVLLQNVAETLLKTLVYVMGPIPIAIHADECSFYGYRGGIYNNTECDGKEVDHAVLLVGYSEENGTKYWIIKNSWGTGWGEGGYMRILRGASLCGIGSEGIIPMVAKTEEGFVAGKDVRHAYRTVQTAALT